MRINGIVQDYSAAHANPAPAVKNAGVPAAAEDTDKIRIDKQEIQKQKEAESEEKRKALVQQMKEIQANKEMLLEQAESAKAAGKAMAETFEIQRKCLIIALRIMDGDKVPKKDESFLMVNNSKLYLQAIMMRRQKEDAKEHESILEDEEEESGVSSDSGAGDSVSAEDVSGTDGSSDAGGSESAGQSGTGELSE